MRLGFGSSRQQYNAARWCLCAVTVGMSGAAWAGPNVPERVAPLTVEKVAPIGAPDVDDGGLVKAPDLSEVAPLKSETAAGPVAVVKAKPIVNPVASGDSRSAVKVPAVLSQLLARTMSVDEAWRSGALDVDDLLYVFEEYLSPWGAFDEREDATLRRELAGLLVRHGGERLQPLEKLSPKMRLWLADYYWSVKDARVLALAEGILREVKQPVTQGSIPAFLAVERLAWYYRDLGQPEKAAQAWLRVKDYEPSQEWWVPDAMVEVARIYTRQGRTNEADALYTKVTHYDDGWLKGVSLLDRAQVLADAGSYQQARQLLQQPVEGARAELVRVLISALTGYCYYCEGNFGKATDYCRDAVAQVQKLPHNTHLGVSDELAQQSLRWISRWNDSPIRPLS